MKTLKDSEIKKIYEMIERYHEKYLKQFGVSLPRLYDTKGNYTKDALVLVFLTRNYPDTEKVSKENLTKFVRLYFPYVSDVQQARHLGAQKGWFIASGGRHDRDAKLKRGEYKLITLEKAYPNFKGHRGKIKSDKDFLTYWNKLKEKYGYRCATCGSREGQPNYHWPNTITELQRGHKDPQKQLVPGNIIPQCQKCNRADRNNWVYDERGRVIKVSNPNIITRSNKEIRWKVYQILYEEFDGVNPNDKKFNK